MPRLPTAHGATSTRATLCARHAHLRAGDLPNAAYDDDYKPYADAVNKMLQRVSGNETEKQKQHIETMAWASDRSKAWCCRAALASAWVAYAHCAKIQKSWATLEGGHWAEGDLPTWRSKGSLVVGHPIQKPRSTRYLVMQYKQHASPVCSGDYGRDGAGW